MATPPPPAQTDPRNLLNQIPRLGNAPFKSPSCKICGSASAFFDIVDFNKCCVGDDYFVSAPSDVGVTYYRCASCDFTFSDFCDGWTSEDFQKYIYNDEYVLVDPEYPVIRPAYIAENMTPLLAGCESLRIIDYGAGACSFANEMRQRGFQAIENYDPFSSPAMPPGRFDIACLFEVIEHMPDPMTTLRALLRDVLTEASLIILTQSLQPQDFAHVRGRWWYIAPRNGHISTYSERTFAHICEALNLAVFPLRYGYYAFYRSSATYEGPIAEFIALHRSTS